MGPLGVEGTLLEIHGKHAEVDVRGKRLRAALAAQDALKGAGLRILTESIGSPTLAAQLRGKPIPGLELRVEEAGAGVLRLIASVPGSK